MRFPTNRGFLVILAALVLGVALPASAGAKKFVDSDASKEKDEPTGYLKDYDKLVEGKEADWVYFDGFEAKAYKTVKINSFKTSGKGSRLKGAAEDGPGYLEQWIKKSKKLGWTVVTEGKADLTVDGNVANAWEPSGAARFWGGWYANPGCVQELMAKDEAGKIVFQIRHKSKGSTLPDAVENGLEKVVETLEKGK
jgi:hypothetical protein